MASKLYGVNATIIIFVFLLYCIVSMNTQLFVIFSIASVNKDQEAGLECNTATVLSNAKNERTIKTTSTTKKKNKSKALGFNQCFAFRFSC